MTPYQLAPLIRLLKVASLESIYINVESNSILTAHHINELLAAVFCSKHLRKLELYFTRSA